MKRRRQLGRTATALPDFALPGVDAFAGGAPQEGDATAVRVGRALPR